jgi:hypothetical protein
MTGTRIDIDEVLARVAAGELTPGQALDLLGPAEEITFGEDAVDAAAASPRQAPRDVPPPAAKATRPRPPGSDQVRRLVLRTSARSVQVSTDPAVAEVSIFGEHELRRDGESLIIENPSALDDRPGRYSVASSIARAIPHLGTSIEIRMNPSLFLDAELNAAAIRLRGAPAGLRMRLLACALKVEDLVGSIDIDASSSSIKGTMTLVGQNRIDCESSSCKVVLARGSDVTIRAQNQMGKIVLPTVVSKGSLTTSDLSQATVGRGRGTLSIESTMSSVVIGSAR